MKRVPVLKDDAVQQPVPTEWRKTICSIVDALVERDYSLQRSIDYVPQLSQEKAKRLAQNIVDYGVVLRPLPAEAWDSSVCQWMRGFWEVLIDLFSEEEGRSDLVLSLRVYEADLGFRYEVESVHVP